MGTLAALLIPLLPSAINAVEELFKAIATPKQGENKADAVLQAVRAIVTKLIASGAPVAQPTDDALKGMIEAKFQDMKASGALGATPSGTGKIYILQGGSITELIAK